MTVIAFVALLVPAEAGAATVVNGDFEVLTGWQIHNSNIDGSWYRYSGIETTFGPYFEESEREEIEEEKAEGKPGREPLDFHFFPPPFGTSAALSDEVGPLTTILYQDISLEPYYSHKLSLTLYYKSYGPIVVPSPNSLATDQYEAPVPFENQQLRVDVMNLSAPIESLNPSDILATLYASRTGDSEVMAPTQFSADLSQFAGQTVRLRLANAVNEDVFNSGVDAVSIASVPPSNVFTRRQLRLNQRKGTGSLLLSVPGAGTVTAVDSGAMPGVVSSTSSSKVKPKRIKRATAAPTAAGEVEIPLRPTFTGREVLKAKRRLRVKLQVTFTPTGGFAATQTYRVTLKLKPRNQAYQREQHASPLDGRTVAELDAPNSQRRFRE